MINVHVVFAKNLQQISYATLCFFGFIFNKNYIEQLMKSKLSKINCVFKKYSWTLIAMHLFFFPVVYTDQKEDCALHQLRPAQKG